MVGLVVRPLQRLKHIYVLGESDYQAGRWDLCCSVFRRYSRLEPLFEGTSHSSPRGPHCSLIQQALLDSQEM